MKLDGNSEQLQRIALSRVHELVDADAATRDAALSEMASVDPLLAAAVKALLGKVTEDPAVSRIVAEDDFVPGERLGQFELRELLSHNTSGEVYLAERADGQFDQKVVVKRIRHHFAYLSETFRRERNILARMHHRNIATLLDGGTTPGGDVWFALEHVDGVSIVRYCNERQLDLRKRVDLFQQLCSAVSFAHRNLVIHCDLKPSNVLVDHDGEVVLLDFGISRLLDGMGATQANSLAITPSWSAPEQSKTEPLTTQVDVYQLGLILRALLCGQVGRGQQRRRLMSQYLQVVEQASPEHGEEIATARATTWAKLRSALLGDLDAIVAKATEENAQKRYASVDELSDDLQRWSRNEPLAYATTSRTYVWRKFVRRHAARLMLATAIGLGLTSVLGLALWNGYQDRQAQLHAMQEAKRSASLLAFLQRILQIGSVHANGGQMSLAQTLNRGATLIDTEFSGSASDAMAAKLMLAKFYQSLGEYPASLPLVDDVLGWSSLDKSPDLKASALSLLSKIRLQQGQQGVAMELQREALAIYAKDPARFALESNENLAALGWIQDSRGESDAALKTLQEMIDTRENVLKLRDTTLADAYSLLGLAYRHTGQFDRAMEAADKGMLILEDLGMEHSTRSSDIRNLQSVIAGVQGHYAEAENIQRIVLDDYERLYGKDAADYGGYLMNLSRWVVAQGRVDEGLALISQSEDIVAKHADTDGPMLNMIRMIHAELLVRSRRFKAAKAKFLQVEDGLVRSPELHKVMDGRLELARAEMAFGEGDRQLALQHLLASDRHYKAMGASADGDRIRRKEVAEMIR